MAVTLAIAIVLVPAWAYLIASAAAVRRFAQRANSLSSSRISPSPPFRGEREGPAKREGEVGTAANRLGGPPHPTLSPRPAGREGIGTGVREEI